MRTRRQILLWFTAHLLAASPGARAQDAPAAMPRTGTITHTWTPVRRGETDVVAIAVRTVIADLPEAATRDLSLSVPITYAGVTGIAERTKDLVVRDADGDLALTVLDDAPDPSGFPTFRHWRAARAVRFPVVVSYEALAPTTPMRAPPFGLYAAHGGVSGAGAGFLVLPEVAGTVVTRIHWDLRDLATGAEAATSFGDGDVEVRGTADSVRQGWIMAGPLGSFRGEGEAHGFSAHWLGTPEWDPAAEMAWTARMYAWLARSYGYLSPAPGYRVFIRVGARGGTALGNSFMVGAVPRAASAPVAAQGPRETFTHELGHLFVGAIEAPQGISSWFSEGLNTYYTRLLPMRGGFTSVEAYRKSVNADMQEYWHGAARNLSADSIARIGFRDEAVRHMPYMRSSLYFADLDAQILARSRGRRTLDEVLRELFERRARGERFDHDAWIRTVTQEAGPGARATFEGVILQGSTTLVPAPDAFGPCLTRRSTPATVVDGVARAAGYEWVRVPSLPDSVCRAWGEPPVPEALARRRPTTSTTRHVGTFGGVRIPYVAQVEEHLLTAPDGRANASLVTIAYLRADVRHRARRPVMFVFNGGPGASSSPLHMGGLGPRLTAGDHTVPNAESILDATDLVFIDPVGTGFSRPFTTGAGRHHYWTRSGDAAAVATVIRRWLTAHGREASPRYLAGESYGTLRAGFILRDHPDLAFNGVMLVGVVANWGEDGGGLTGRVDALPTMAASAWFHGAGSREAHTVDEAFNAAAQFATGEYRAALEQGPALSAAERDRVAARMSALLGVPAAFIVARDLRLTNDDWMLQVLAPRGLRTGMLDTRVTAPRDTTRTGGLNDPSFNGGTMRIGTAWLAPALLPGEMPAGPATTPSPLERYLTRDLAFPTRERYRSINLDINVIWDHEGGGGAAPALAAAMRARPSLRLFWTGGYYDLTTPAGAVQRAFGVAGMPADRVTASLVPAAHGVFADAESRRVLGARLRAWLQ